MAARQNKQKGKAVKIQLTLCSILAASLIAGCESDNQSRLQADAKISKADAEATALTKAPNGTIKEAELEREHGKLIWSFDIATPDSPDITEVNVDAITGAVVGISHEKADSEKPKTN
jgi:uncharacterized membrane protein YkoI